MFVSDPSCTTIRVSLVEFGTMVCHTRRLLWQRHCAESETRFKRKILGEFGNHSVDKTKHAGTVHLQIVVDSHLQDSPTVCSLELTVPVVY